ncbi:hypothetical protein BHF71_05805 [Vulcanibacillus modesticaldus]|uniref:Type I-B CRISPR-associated protein Cas8b1/Cst1 n=1 Tax=Vulcanibacillus modesticaldus TaxID=337097 RepID=A0A1D2YWR5_9BACI|nr:hypothetical protein [Vulcanibacillus modesticaldus]OEG00201.1 hypothetical protein BHF71_05805 [Vulcanibacillus modesticaldus]
MALVNSFTYWKNKGNYADVLAAVGLAQLIYHLTGEYPKIEDRHSFFYITLPNQIDLEKLPYHILLDDPGYEAMDNQKYEKIKEQAKAYREKSKNISNLTEEERQHLEQEKPRDDWSLFQNLKIIQALNTYNKLHENIRNADKEKFIAYLKHKLKAYSIGELSESGGIKYSLSVSAVQAFNPSIGKGVNRTKPDGAAISSFPKSMVDWFQEYLRFLGIASSFHSYLIDKDIKFIAVSPGKIPFDILSTKIMHDFRSKNIGWTTIKVDVMAVLTLALILLDYLDIVKNHKVNQILNGIQIANFKDMGQVKALMNQSFIRLPGWFPINSNDDADDMRLIIKEHMDCLRYLDEKKSEEAQLLQLYRDGLSGDDLGKIIKFLAGYGIHRMRKLNTDKNRKNYVPAITEDKLRRLVMKSYPAYSEIIRNTGFQNIAKAVRNATINEQIAKSKGRNNYKIHYELFQQIKQNATFPDKFLGKLLEFINEYNKETARKIEQKDKDKNTIFRPLVSTQDIDDFIKLFDKYRQQSETIAMLLIAYASSKTIRSDGTGNSTNSKEEIIIEE